MRLNRRKNRGSWDRRKRTLAREEKPAGETPGDDREERRRDLAQAVESLRSSVATGRRDRREERSRRRAVRADRPRRRRRLRLEARKRRPRGERQAHRPALLKTARSVATDVVGVAREILRWPVRIWMTVAEALGTAILAAWRRAVLPALRVVLRWLSVALLWGERTVTPARGLMLVAVAATIALGGSQFSDYRGVEVGAPEYAQVENVAPAPQVDRAMPRSAHGIWVFAIAVASLFVILFAVWRNWRLARLLLFGGLAVVAISLFVDRPDGLRLGTAGEAYSGAHAVLLGAFWVQLFAGAT